MTVIAGTSRGTFLLQDGQAVPVLPQRGVRDLVAIGERVFAGTSAGLFTSSDAGANWTAAGIEGRAVWQVRASADEAVLYASAEPAELFCSRDGGASWQALDAFAQQPQAAQWCVPVTPQQPARARALVVDQLNPARLMVGVEVGGIAASDDAGATWRMTLPGDNPDIHMMCAHPAQPDVLFVSTGYGRLDGVAEMIEGNAGVFRSDDAGATWRYVWRGVTPRYSRPMCIDTRAPYALTVASAPTAFSSVHEAGGAQAMLFRSDDGGESWRSLGDAAHAPSGANFHGLAPDPSEPGTVVVGTDSGEVWRVTSAGEWTCLATGLPTVLSLLVV